MAKHDPQRPPIFVYPDGKPVPERERSTSEAYDEAAAQACSWTLFEMGEGEEDYGLTQEDLLDALDMGPNDEVYEVFTRRTSR